VLLAIVFLAGLCCWLLFSWQVCVMDYCFPSKFVLLAIAFLAAVLLAIVFLAGLCCWLAKIINLPGKQYPITQTCQENNTQQHKSSR
jgi:hypothetical protein